MLEPFDIDIRHGGDGAARALRQRILLRQQMAILRDQAMPAEDQVGRRFGGAGAGVGVGGDAAGGLRLDEALAVRPFADELVARLQVQQHGCAGQRLV